MMSQFLVLVLAGGLAAQPHIRGADQSPRTDHVYGSGYFADQWLSDRLQNGALKRAFGGSSLASQPGEHSFSLRYGEGGYLTYDITVWAPSHCYVEGPVRWAAGPSEESAGKTALHLEVVMEFVPGYCAQAVKKLRYQGTIKEALPEAGRVLVKVSDTRTGKSKVHSIVPD